MSGGDAFSGFTQNPCSSVLPRVAISRFFSCCGPLGNIEGFSNECCNAKTTKSKKVNHKAQKVNFETTD